MEKEELRRVAYFSMEVALDPKMKTYSGGLGVLAGDMLTSAADLKIPMVGITLLNRKGYFHQAFDASGWQQESEEGWPIEECLTKQNVRIAVTIENREVYCTAWKYEITGISGFKVPVYFLDTSLPENTESDRTLTDYLYGKDTYYRLCQEVVLGIGGVRLLHALGYTSFERYHMNEGHAAFLALELLDEYLLQTGSGALTRDVIEAVREKCVFTSHTPVPAGHDKFPMDMVAKVLGQREVFEMDELYSFENCLNMTYLALNLSKYVNGVSKRNAEIEQLAYAPYKVDAITNGVHAIRWTAQPFQALFDQHIPGWRTDNFSLRRALGIPKEQFWEAHLTAKRLLLDRVKKEVGVEMDLDVLTLGFARRATSYKRADLLFQDKDRLKKITGAGRFQIIFGGKAHPNDQEGKEMIKRIFQDIEAVKDSIKIAYLPNYELELAHLITSGVDVWLNTPQPPLEASGTSGMKAALNGIPSLSILDGWWNEGCIEGMTGWAIGTSNKEKEASDRNKDAASLYDKLEQEIIPLFYHNHDQFITIMQHAIALNGSFFHTQRMVLQYDLRAYYE